MKTKWTIFKEYTLIESSNEILLDIMSENSELILDTPVDVFGGYVVYSISNFNGCIMVDTILNSEMHKAEAENREPRHEISTKGTESANFILATLLIIRGEITYKEVMHPEWKGKKVTFVIG